MVGHCTRLSGVKEKGQWVKGEDCQAQMMVVDSERIGWAYSLPLNEFSFCTSFLSVLLVVWLSSGFLLSGLP